jgi:hypothetical protein
VSKAGGQDDLKRIRGVGIDHYSIGGATEPTNAPLR